MTAFLLGGCWEKIEYRGTIGETADAATTPALSNSTPNASSDPVQTATNSAAALASAAETAVTDSPAIPVSTMIATSPPAAISTKRAAWTLGSRLCLAALANDRGNASDEVRKWFGEASVMAESLDVSIVALPQRPENAGSNTPSREILGYILEQEKTIGPKLAAAYGDDHDAIFRLAVRTNLLGVLNTPGTKAVDTLSQSITDLGPRSGLPMGLWQPLLDVLHDGATSAAIRAAVTRMHEKIEQHLAAER